MGHIILDNLSSFGIEGSDKIAKISFKAILSFVFSYVEEPFIAYEEEIDRQKKVIAQLLRFKNERLENGPWHSIGASSHDKLSTDNSYTSLRSLSRHAACVANVVRTQSGGCDMKA